jgi:hypothetical protein
MTVWKVADIRDALLRAVVAWVLLITASAQKNNEDVSDDVCFDPDDPQSILIAKQTKESIDLGNAEVFVKSQLTDESGKESVWVYETRSVHKGDDLEQTPDNCLRQTSDIE